MLCSWKLKYRKRSLLIKHMKIKSLPFHFTGSRHSFRASVFMLVAIYLYNRQASLPLRNHLVLHMLGKHLLLHEQT